MAGYDGVTGRREFWHGRRVLVTGHMGFKGTWLTYLLARFGARTIGFGFDERDPLLYRAISIENHQHVTGDVNDLAALRNVIAEHGVQVVFHLAAQALVRDSYREPLRTFRDNIMGTATVMEALRTSAGVDAGIIVTSDKVYANREWVWSYRENEALGGHDPYSASKAAAEIVTEAMNASFLSGRDDAPRVATVRAGNVIGGGDWAADRLLPDAARAYSSGRTLVVRNPDSTRPWQHVLDPLSGYMRVAEAMSDRSEGATFRAWNFGPTVEDALPVSDVVDRFSRAWGGEVRWEVQSNEGLPAHEARYLSVDSSRARAFLGWSPRWRVDEAIERTAKWYSSYYRGEGARMLMDRDIDAYLS